MAQAPDSRRAGPAPESAAAQITMLRNLLGAAPVDEEGMVRVHRDHLLHHVDQIDTDHRRELEALPTIAGRMLSVFGVTV